MRLVDVARQALLLTLTLSLPTLAASLAAGVVAGLGASAARLYDPLVTAVPRQLAVAAVLALSGATGAALLVRFTSELWAAIPTLVR